MKVSNICFKILNFGRYFKLDQMGSKYNMLVSAVCCSIAFNTCFPLPVSWIAPHSQFLVYALFFFIILIKLLQLHGSACFFIIVIIVCFSHHNVLHGNYDCFPSCPIFIA